ncbi:hypothetical protein BDV25DRAFT_121653 [Aspergillus avenaceus]|uniref:Uncharacterized protein n=1 Tax=Aspergillus avenaceus TaxID=36643 RepID=A0A5N6U6P4_ASPAV|nr:hypothetical protein BDV25DRAFT_121653 [Aspergillus avenaceus]
MPRGAEYDNNVVQSDNAIEAGPNKVHGTGGSEDLKRVQRTAPLPDAAKSSGSNFISGGGSEGHSSGKGGHEPKTLGENKGFGAHKA